MTGALDDHAAGYERPCANAPTPTPSEVGGLTDWKLAADELCGEMLKQAPGQVRKVADELYETLLNTVQDYLRENADYNLSADLSRAKRDAKRAESALRNVASALGVSVEGFPNYPTPEMLEEQAASTIERLSADLADLRAKADALLTACYRADEDGDLSDHVDGSLMEALSAALAASQPEGV